MKKTGEEKNFDFLAPLYSANMPKFVSGEGVAYYTADGKEYIDMNEMRVVLGQRNKEFEEAMLTALRGITAPKDDLTEAKQRLYQYLNTTTGGKFAAAHLTSSGSESVEAAVRLAKKLTGRTEIISFWNSIHGRTFLSSSLSGVPKRKVGYGPLALGGTFFPYPNCNECPLMKNCENCEMACLGYMNSIYENTSAQDAAAVLVEPYQGSGIIMPPQGFLKKLQEWARSKGMLLIVDEIQSGMGRTGNMYCYQKEDLDPDILLLGKALGNGAHISAMLVKDLPRKEDLYIFSGGSGDDVLSCTAACEIFRQLENGLLEHVRYVGGILCRGLKKFEENSLIQQCRGEGLAAAVTFYDEQVCGEVCNRMKECGYLVGHNRKVLFCKPSYVITDEQISGFLSTMEMVLNQL